MSDYSNAELARHQRRAQAHLYRGPVYGSQGHYPTVQQVTIHEIEFDDSDSAVRYMKQVGRKDPNARTLVNSKHLQFISADDE